MKVAFLLNDLQLSGGVGVVVHHARELATRHGYDVTLVLVREQDAEPWEFEGLAHLHVEGLAEARSQRFDVAIATWWETTFSLFQLEAARYAYFVQSLEDRFYGADAPERYAAMLTTGLPVTFITEARWIATTLQALRPEARCYYVRNGIDKAVFSSPRSIEVRTDQPLRVVIEGNPTVPFKGVHEAIAAVADMREPVHLTVVADRSHLTTDHANAIVGPLTHREMAQLYARSDLVLKLSRVEGMFGPPLEGFHMGATAVVAPVTGYDEYIVHGWNGWVVDWDDHAGTTRALDLLARDRRLLTFLRSNALETAAGWPSWQQAAMFFAATLVKIIQEPPPPPYAGARQLVTDHRLLLDLDRRRVRERDEYRRVAQPALRLKQSAAWRIFQWSRRSRALAPLRRRLHPVTARVRRKLLG